MSQTSIWHPYCLTSEYRAPLEDRRETKYCETCGKPFVKPVLLRQRDCYSCVRTTDRQESVRELQVQSEVRQETNMRFRRSGAEHPVDPKERRTRVRPGRHAVWVEPLTAKLKAVGPMTAKDLNVIMGYSSSASAAHQAAKQLDLVVVGFAESNYSGRGKRRLALYGFREQGYRATNY